MISSLQLAVGNIQNKRDSSLIRIVEWTDFCLSVLANKEGLKDRLPSAVKKIARGKIFSGADHNYKYVVYLAMSECVYCSNCLKTRKCVWNFLLIRSEKEKRSYALGGGIIDQEYRADIRGGCHNGGARGKILRGIFVGVEIIEEPYLGGILE